MGYCIRPEQSTNPTAIPKSREDTKTYRFCKCFAPSMFSYFVVYLA